MSSSSAVNVTVVVVAVVEEGVPEIVPADRFNPGGKVPLDM